MTEHSRDPPFPQAEQRALRKYRFVYFSNTGPVQDMDRIKPLIQAFLANAERLINAAKDVHKPSLLSLPWQVAMWCVRASWTLQVPLRIALRQTVSASTPRDVPLP